MHSDTINPLVEYSANFKVGDIPEDVLEKSKDLFLDTVACIYAGNTADGIQPLLNMVKSCGGNSQASLIGFGEKTSAPQAAFLNSVMGHARDFDDTHDAALNHGCVTIVPAMIAVCELLHWEDNTFRISGREFLGALAIGLDVGNRMGMAFIRHLHTGWLPTTLWGPFSCAVACGRLMHFNVGDMLKAFGIAYSLIHGNRQTLIDGALTKRIQPGFSAEAGVKSVMMAREGITGAENIIDGDYGIPALYTNGNVDKEWLTDDLGNTFETLNVSMKPYPSCRCTHPVIDAVKYLKQEHNLSADDFSEGKIYLPPKGMGQIGKPFKIRDNPTVDAQFSAQYTVALALVQDTVKIDDFSTESVTTKKHLIDWTKKFKVEESFLDYPGLVPVKVELTLKNGETITSQIETPTGSREKPMSREAQKSKFYDCLSHSLNTISDQECDKIYNDLNTLLSTDDVLQLISSLLK